MSPENTKIFLVEDDLIDQEQIRWILEKNGHSIVVEAETLDEALLQIPELREKGVNVAIVDGNLTEGVGSGEDGRRVTERIKELHGEEIQVVSHSATEKSYGYGDAFVAKDIRNRNLPKLAEIITQF